VFRIKRWFGGDQHAEAEGGLAIHMPWGGETGKIYDRNALEWPLTRGGAGSFFFPSKIEGATRSRLKTTFLIAASGLTNGDRQSHSPPESGHDISRQDDRLRLQSE